MATQEQLKEWFNSVDTDGSGTLAYSELSDFLIENRGFTTEQVEKIFDTADTSGDGQITMEEYVSAMQKQSPDVHNESSLRMMCRSFDKNGDGTIDKHEMKAVFDELQRNLTAEDVERIMKMTDTDGDGVIDYNELCQKVFGKSCD